MHVVWTMMILKRILWTIWNCRPASMIKWQARVNRDYGDGEIFNQLIKCKFLKSRLWPRGGWYQSTALITSKNDRSPSSEPDVRSWRETNGARTSQQTVLFPRRFSLTRTSTSALINVLNRQNDVTMNLFSCFSSVFVAWLPVTVFTWRL